MLLNQITRRRISNATNSIITLLPADGIGPALIDGVKKLFESVKAPLNYEIIEQKNAQSTSDLMKQAIESLKRNKVGLKGNWITPIDGPTTSLNVELRHRLDLFANIVHCKKYEGIKTLFPYIDIVIVRQNTEGEYSHLEHENIPGVVEMIKVVTEARSRQIAKFAFDYAVANKRSHVTCVHKANIMKLSDGLFLRICKDVSLQYPSVKFNDVIIDNCCMQLVKNPTQFDVMVMPNLYGNIVSNVAASLVGGPGISAGVNYGADGIALFESGTRNTGRDLKPDTANPICMIAAACQLLRHLSLNKHAERIEKSLFNLIASRSALTVDQGGNTKTSQFFEMLIDTIHK